MHCVTSSCKGTGRSLRHPLASPQMVDKAEKHPLSHHQKDATGHLQSNSTTAHLLLVEEEEAQAQSGCKERSDYHEKVSSEIVVMVEGDHDDQSSFRLDYVNKLTSREMDSLTALCDTFLPSVQDDVGILESDRQAVVNFFRTSASMAATPHYSRHRSRGRPPAGKFSGENDVSMEREQESLANHSSSSVGNNDVCSNHSSSSVGRNDVRECLLCYFPQKNMSPHHISNVLSSYVK